MTEQSRNTNPLEASILLAIYGKGGHVKSELKSNAISSRGVLSGIVLMDWESQSHGEGPDGSTQPAKETYPGHAGSDKGKPTSLQGLATQSKTNKKHRFRNLYQQINIDTLVDAWGSLNKNAASGVNKVTAEEYQKHLGSNLFKLAEKLKTKRYRTRLVRRYSTGCLVMWLRPI